MGRRAIAYLLVIVWLAGLAAVAFNTQAWHIKKIQYAQPYRDSLALPTPERAKIMALGYDNMMASLLWLRVIQVFGAKLHHIREDKYELAAIENAFNVITELDPRFIDAYKFGNFVLGDEGGDQQAALRLLQRGIDKNGNRTYVLAYEAAFICITNLKDYDRARRYIEMAMQAPDCEPYVERVIQYIETKKGNFEIALERWVREYLQSKMRNQDYMLVVARQQIVNTVNFWHLDIIDKALKLYHERHGDYPARLEQLVEDGGIEKSNRVNPTRLTQMLEALGETRMPLENAVALVMGPVAKGGVIYEDSGLPVDPKGEPYLYIDDTRIPVEKLPIVVDRDKIRRLAEYALAGMRRRIEQFQTENGRYPRTIDELPQLQGQIEQGLSREDPAGLPWNYNPATGKLSSYVFPEL